MNFSKDECAKIDTSTEQGRHDFLDLCKNNETEAVKVLVKNNPAYVHAKEAGRHNAVMQAAHHGNMDLLRLLADYNPDYGYAAKGGKTGRDGALELYQSDPAKGTYVLKWFKIPAPAPAAVANKRAADAQDGPDPKKGKA